MVIFIYSCYMDQLGLADVASSKRHQRLDEILIIFTRTIQEIGQVVCKKTMSETCACITSLYCMKHAHYCKRWVSRAYCMTRVFWKQLCWFLWCSAGKKKQDFVQPLVSFPISNISYWSMHGPIRFLTWHVSYTDHWIHLLNGYKLVQWWRHFIMLPYQHVVTGSSIKKKGKKKKKPNHQNKTDDRAGDTVTCVCVTNEKNMALQQQIWSTFVTVLWFRKTKTTDGTGILVLLRVLQDMVSKIHWQFWHSFFKNALESSYNFHPIEIT